MVAILASLLFALSLCADCFAVAACSSVTLSEISWKKIAIVAVVFALTQSLLFFAGWAFGDLLTGVVGKFAPLAGFLLLLYVGGSMLVSAIRGEEERRDLNGIRNIMIGAVATSIDALAAGMSLSMDGDSLGDIVLKTVAIMLVTALSVVLGMRGGMAAGRRYGRPALVIGGTVLIFIGLNILF